MIRLFKDKETEKIYRQQYSGKLPGPMQKTALRKLIMIDHAESLNDLLVPPGNRLESLSGKRKVNTAYESTISIEFALSTEIMTFIQSKYVTITRRQEYEQQD